MKRENIFVLLISILLIFSLVQCVTSTLQAYRNDEMGVSFQYPDSWELIENDVGHVSLNYQGKDSAQTSVYLAFGSTEIFEGDTPLQILENQVTKWRINDGSDRFRVLQEPHIADFHGEKIAKSTSSIILYHHIGSLSSPLVLDFTFYEETLVITRGDNTVIIVISSRRQEIGEPISSQIEGILDSFSFEE